MKMRTYGVLAMAGAVLMSSCGSDTKSSSCPPASAAATGAAMFKPVANALRTTPSVPGAPAGPDCQPVKEGILSVVTSLPGPNFWGTSNGESDPDLIKSGIEYDLANLIAAKCGLTMSFRNESFDALVAGQVAADSYDIALSQVTITKDRAKVVNFSQTYFTSDQGLLVAKGTVVKSWDDVRKLEVAVQASTTAEFDVTSGKVPGWKLDKVKVFPDLSSAYAALNAGSVDAVMIDTPINLGQAAQSGGKLEVVAQFRTGEGYGAIYGFGQGREAIFDPILQGFLDDGTINGLIAKYLGGDPTSVPFIDIPQC